MSMTRLNNAAFEILRAEVKNCADAAILQVQQEIVLKRLSRLRNQSGSPASLSELRDTVVDIIPNFNQKALKAAARANSPVAANLNKLKWGVGFLVGASGLVWIANLPYPMIRLPIARKVPILLLPSYISIDYNYRQAVAKVEQADQLINQPTSVADLIMGEVKLKEAQKHLDALPVWFLGYIPQYNFFGSWQFSLDQFEQARANVGRLQAKVFQEKNAQIQLTKGIKAFKAAKDKYKAAGTQTAASMQAAIDTLSQVPPETLAGRIAQTQLSTLERDFEQVSTLITRSTRTSTLIAAAQQFALSAAQAAKNPPHTASEWHEITQLWEQAIHQLQQVALTDPGYVKAQKLLAKYQTNLGNVRTRLQAEQESQAALQQAKSLIPMVADGFSKQPSPRSLRGLRQETIAQLQSIIIQLKNVNSGTTAYSEAQRLLQSAQKKLDQLNS